jgi:hypothetical protein
VQLLLQGLLEEEGPVLRILRVIKGLLHLKEGGLYLLFLGLFPLGARPGQGFDRVAVGALDGQLHELVGQLAAVAELEGFVLGDVLAVEGGQREVAAAAAERHGESFQGVAASKGEDERDHAQDGQGGENDFLVFPEAVQRTESHFASLTYGDKGPGSGPART